MVLQVLYLPQVTAALPARAGVRASISYGVPYDLAAAVSLSAFVPAVDLSTLFMLFLSPLPPGGPGEGPDCPFPKEIVRFGPFPARLRRETYF